MQLIKPIFNLEAKLQAAALAPLGGGDELVAEVRQELDGVAKTPCVVYTYALSPFSTEAVALLESTGCTFETRQLGLEWFLLGPRGSVLRNELLDRTGQSSLPHVFVGGQSVGGLATGSPGLAALAEDGNLVALLKGAKAL